MKKVDLSFQSCNALYKESGVVIFSVPLIQLLHIVLALDLLEMQLELNQLVLSGIVRIKI